MPDLAAMFDQLARIWEGGIAHCEKMLGMTFAENAIQNAQQGDCARMFDLPIPSMLRSSGSWAAVRDFLTPEYDGVSRAQRGDVLPELVLNKIPEGIPIERKLQIAQAQHAAALDAPDVDTVAGTVRALISGAQLEILTEGFAGTFVVVGPRPKERGALLDGVFRMLKGMNEVLSQSKKGKDQQAE